MESTYSPEKIAELSGRPQEWKTAEVHYVPPPPPDLWELRHELALLEQVVESLNVRLLALEQMQMIWEEQRLEEIFKEAEQT